jgi:putative phosphoesterase
MRFLVISDIHSNYTALESVIHHAEPHDARICVGDIVGYGPQPQYCIDLIREQNFSTVIGNHDNAIITSDISWFNFPARKAIEINRKLLDQNRLSWLQSLTKGFFANINGVKIAVYHGSPEYPMTEYVYPSDAERKANQLLNQSNADLLILGHTHIPYTVKSGIRVIMNPGSVGQPRDGDSRSSYAIVDVSEKDIKVTFRRIEYDIDVVANMIRGLGLPEQFASRLYFGL